MKTNKKLISKCKNIVSKYQHKKKRQDPNISIELPDNHFFNKMAQDDKIDFSVKKNKKNKDKKYVKHLNKKDLTLKDSQMSGPHLYETICKKNTLSSMPSTLLVMPLIPFWQSSFEIIGHEYQQPTSAWRQDVSSRTIRPSQPLYVTMKRKIDQTEPIYV